MLFGGCSHKHLPYTIFLLANKKTENISINYDYSLHCECCDLLLEIKHCSGF